MKINFSWLHVWITCFAFFLLNENLCTCQSQTTVTWVQWLIWKCHSWLKVLNKCPIYIFSEQCGLLRWENTETRGNSAVHAVHGGHWSCPGWPVPTRVPHSAPPIWWSSWGACGFSRNHCDFNPKAPKHLNVLELGRHSSLGRWESESRGRALSPGQLAVVEPSSISHRDTAWDPPGEEAKLVGDRDPERGYG